MCLYIVDDFNQLRGSRLPWKREQKPGNSRKVMCTCTELFHSVLVLEQLHTYGPPHTICAATCGFQLCVILTRVHSDESLQPPFKPRNSKCSMVSSLTVIEYASD